MEVTPPGDRRYFFILGTPRSGTTLLQSMLMQSEGVTIPAETHYLAMVSRGPGRPRVKLDGAQWEKFQNSLIARSIADQIEFDHDHFRALAADAPRTYAGLLRALLDAVGDHANARVVGEKSPAHTEHAALLAEMMPEARFVHITRDPRDVSASHRAAFGKTILGAALRWRKDARADEVCRDRMPADRYRHLRYEDLIASPEQTLRDLCGFLRIDFDPRMTDPSNREQRGFAETKTHVMLTLEPLSTSRIGRYKEKLSMNEIALVEAVCRRGMTRLSYPFESPGVARAAAQFCSDAPRFLVKRIAGRRKIRRRMLEREQTTRPEAAGG